MNVCDRFEGFFSNETSAEMYVDRYKHGDEDPLDTIRRVAHFLSKGDLDDYSAFYDVMAEHKAYPAGRTMANSGIGEHLTLNNCFVPYQVPNDMGEIYECVKIGALTHKAGGGTGYDFSLLAPNGTVTHNNAIASGPVSFMKSFDAQTDTVKSGNRRGANMGVLSVYHPDIREFINAKATDANVLQYFNLSVMVDDAFMNAVENDRSITLHYPVYNDKGTLEHDPNNWERSEEISATDLWNEIMRMAYNNGEPGILQYDTMNRDNNLWYVENIVATNPCFTGDMKLLTYDEEYGQLAYYTFQDLEGRDDVAIFMPNGGISFNNKVWCSGLKNIVGVKFADGRVIKCTPDHIFMLNDGTECKAKDLKGKRVKTVCSSEYCTFDDDYIKMGFIQGDGQTTRLNSKYHKGIEVNIGKNDDDIMKLFKDEEFTRKSDRCIYLQSDWVQRLIDLEFNAKILPYRTLPTTFSKWSNKEQRSFMRGLFSANGCVVKGHRVQFKTTCRELADELQRWLSNHYDIESNITTNKAKSIKFANGEYECRESYDLCINQLKSIIRFAECIGFVHEYKTKALQELIDARSPYVVSVTDYGVEPVYDFTEHDNHWGVVEGCVVHNCGEYLAGTLYGDNINPTEYGGACNLGSILLHTFVKHPFTPKAYFDEDDFESIVRTMVRMLDNTIDVNTFPVPIYEKYQKAFRTIGLGITSLADAIAMLGMKYNSKEALDWVDYLMDNFAYIAYSESVELAKEKGSFPMLDRDKFIQSGFLQKHCNSYGDKWQNLCDNIKIHGIRNARLISVAPTGTMSLVWGNNCSSGCEPIFSLEYDRIAKVGGQDEENKRTIHVEDYAYSVAKSLGANTSHMTTALEMTVDEHVDMLSKIAYHTDMSVSKTINVPTEYPFEDAKNIYMRCWKEGIKGCTIFRPNELRQGILGVSTEDKPDDNNIRTSFHRGDIVSVNDDLLGYKRKVVNGCGDFQFQLFFDDVTGEPLESYICMGDGGGCAKNLEAISRLISLCFRAGVDVNEVIKQLKKVSPCIAYCNRRKTKGDTSTGTSCPSAIGHALDELNNKIKDRCFADEDWEIYDVPTSPEAVQSESKPQPTVSTRPCPECGEPMLDGAGCVTCPHCGYNSCEHH